MINRSIRVLCFLLAAVLTSSAVHATAWVSETGDAGMSFLKISPSARITALGGASSAYHTGSSSLWSNPALLALSGERTVQLTHLEWIAGIKQEFAAVSVRNGLGSFGLGFQVIDSGEIDGYNEDALETGPYSITNTAITFSYANTVRGLFSFGVTAKKLFEKVSMDTSDGYAVDLGIVADIPVEGLRFALAGRNYGKMGRLRNKRTRLPSDIIAGLHYRYSGFAHPVNLVCDYVEPRYGDSGFRMGVEATPTDIFVVRMGYRTDSDIQSVSFGVGVTIEKFTCDVSYSPMRAGFDDAIRFTLGITGF